MIRVEADVCLACFAMQGNAISHSCTAAGSLIAVSLPLSEKRSRNIYHAASAQSVIYAARRVWLAVETACFNQATLAAEAGVKSADWRAGNEAQQVAILADALHICGAGELGFLLALQVAPVRRDARA